MYPSWNRCLRTWHGNSKSSVTCNVYDPRPEPMAIWPGLLSSWMWFQLDLNQLVCTLICKVWSRCLQCYFRFYHGLYVLTLPAMKKDELCLKTEYKPEYIRITSKKVFCDTKILTLIILAAQATKFARTRTKGKCRPLLKNWEVEDGYRESIKTKGKTGCFQKTGPAFLQPLLRVRKKI